MVSFKLRDNNTWMYNTGEAVNRRILVPHNFFFYLHGNLKIVMTLELIINLQ